MLSHLNALELHLSHERARLTAAKNEGERTYRRIWVAQLEKEVAHERRFLGLSEPDNVEMSDDELLAALIA